MSMCFSKWALNIHLLLYIHASKGGWPPPNVFLSGSSELSKSDETLLVGGKVLQTKIELMSPIESYDCSV